MIYIIENESLNENFIEKAKPYLSKQRTDKLMQLKSLKDKINCCVAFMLLRYGLYYEYSTVEMPLFDFEKREKPYLTNISGISFNFSHCKTAAACIVSKENTAIDIMDIRKIKSSVVRRCCSEEEEMRISTSTDLDREFIRLWTRKECYVKYTGIGLLQDFSEITENTPGMNNIHTIEKKHYIMSYYSSYGDCEIIRPDVDSLFDYIYKKS